MNREECVFCRIVDGFEPAEIVRTWPGAVAITPLNPVTEGHTLVIPGDHVPDAVTDPDTTADVMRCAVRLAADWESSNIVTSIGAAATQSVYHLHAHVIPRRQGDGLMLPWSTAGAPETPH